MADRRQRDGILLAVGLGIALLVAYWPALHGGMLWDDDAHVTRPELRSAEGLIRIWTEPGATQQFYPLLHSVFWLEHRLWGDAVLGYHLANLLQHGLAACLVFLLVRRLELPGAALAAGVWALHPVSVESVAWISEQKNTLSAVLYLGAALCYLKFDATRGRGPYLAAFGLFGLALLTKTVTATLPAALLVIFWWRRGRLGFRRDVAPLLPWFALGIASGLFTAWMERSFIGAQGTDFALGPVERVLLAGRAVCFYFGKLVWPVDLVFIYPRWTIDAAVTWQYVFPLAVAVVGGGFIWLARRRRGPLAALLLYGGTLFPALGFLNVYPFLFSFVADHFQYLASLAVIVPVAGLATRLAAPLPVAGRGALAAALLLGLTLLSRSQARPYADAETLYRTILRANPDCWLAANNLGNLASRSPDRAAEAAALYAEVVRLRPGMADAHYNLANALARLPGRAGEAEAHYRNALRLQPDLVEARNHYGNLLAREPARTPEAIAQFQAALRLEPGFAEVHNNLGNLLVRLPGRRAEAITHYETAVRLQPDFADAHYNLAVAAAREPGGRDRALAAFAAALRLRPDFAEAHFGCGVLLHEDPARRAEADEHFAATLRLRPDWVAARRHIELLKRRAGP
ncbi:MAG: tetratricopeptide repeat protein [Opitutaceae bacterium]|nr:tetratricopeptide repeat protein [Opitutaceae bacterium]